MKHKNQDGSSGRRAIALLAVFAVLGTVTFAGVMAYDKLRSLWLEQSVITDVNTQVTVTAGRRIKADTVREMFGLRDGANLATIDFAARREEALKEYPVIKSISIARKIPDRVFITITERDPFARIEFRNSRKGSGLVCDDEGVVFSCRRGAELLPIIREGEAGSAAGDRIDGRDRAALNVLKTLREPEFANLNVTEIDSFPPDFLLLCLSDYSVVKFCWAGMDSPSPASDAALRSQLLKTAQTIATNLQPDTRVWNATQPGTVSADTKERH